MKPTLGRELAFATLLMALWRRKPGNHYIVHSDQGRQYGSDDFKRFCTAHNLEPSMSRRGNCWDNAVAESFFSSLKNSESVNETTNIGSWPGLMYSITSRCFTTEPAALVIWVASVPKLLIALRLEVGTCLADREQSTDYLSTADHRLLRALEFAASF